MPTYSINDALNSPDQKASQIWLAARKIMDTGPASVYTHVSHDGGHYLLSPSVSASIGSGDHAHTHTFAIAGSADKLGKLLPNTTLFIIANDNIITPALTLNKYGSPFQATSLIEIDDTATIEQVLKMIQKAVNNKTERLRLIEKHRQASRKRRMWWTVIGLTVILVPTGIAGGIYTVVHGKHVQRDQDTARFDARDLTLNGVVISHGETKFLVIDPAIASSDVPEGDLSDHIRRSSIKAGSCITVGRIMADRKLIAASDGPKQNLTVQVDSDGNVAACAIPNASVTERDSDGRLKQPSYDVLFQIK